MSDNLFIELPTSATQLADKVFVASNQPPLMSKSHALPYCRQLSLQPCASVEEYEHYEGERMTGPT